MRFLFVGLGGVGQRHLRNLKKYTTQNDTIYAYRVRNEHKVISDSLQIIPDETIEEKYDIITCSSLEDAFIKKPNAVFICNPTSMHMEIMVEAAKHGCHFFVEKPLSHNLDHVDELLELCDKNRIISYVGYQQRNNPCILKSKELLDNGAIGDVISVDSEIGECVRGWHKYEDYRRMYACRKSMGGGVVLSQIHELDYLYYFFGLPSIIYAIGGKASDLDIDVEDNVDILMRYSGYNRDINVHIHEDYVQNPPSRKCKIIGTKGRIEIDLINLTFQHYDDCGILTIDEKYNIDRNSMFEREMQSFLHCVYDNKQSPIPVEVGLESLKMALAVKQSIDENRIIEF